MIIQRTLETKLNDILFFFFSIASNGRILTRILNGTIRIRLFPEWVYRLLRRLVRMSQDKVSFEDYSTMRDFSMKIFLTIVLFTLIMDLTTNFLYNSF